MIIDHIDKSTAIQTVVWSEKFFSFLCSRMFIGIGIDGTVKHDTALYPDRIIEFFFAFYKITDHITYQYFRVLERQVSMSEIVHSLKIANKAPVFTGSLLAVC